MWILAHSVFGLMSNTGFVHLSLIFYRDIGTGSGTVVHFNCTAESVSGIGQMCMYKMVDLHKDTHAHTHTHAQTNSHIMMRAKK